MGIFETYVVSCDECGEVLERCGEAVLSDTMRDAEDEAKEAGWLRSDDDDELILCSYCRKEHAKDGAP